VPARSTANPASGNGSAVAAAGERPPRGTPAEHGNAVVATGPDGHSEATDYYAALHLIPAGTHVSVAEFETRRTHHG